MSEFLKTEIVKIGTRSKDDVNGGTNHTVHGGTKGAVNGSSGSGASAKSTSRFKTTLITTRKVNSNIFPIHKCTLVFFFLFEQVLGIVISLEFITFGASFVSTTSIILLDRR
jgi:hypothetical protein